MAALGFQYRERYGRARRAYEALIDELGDSPLRNAFPLPTFTWDGDQNPEVRRRLETLLWADPDLLDACTTTRRGAA